MKDEMTEPGKKKKNDGGERFNVLQSLKQFEIVFVILSLLATVVFAYWTVRQATHHFELERTSQFVMRFNSPEMVELRNDVDDWLETGESASDLYERSRSKEQAESKDAKAMIAKLRTMANFFQEFGSAIKLDSVNEEYAQVLLGSVCVRYGESLEPFIRETRLERGRPNVYEEVFLLSERMDQIDEKKARRSKTESQ